VMAYMSIAFLKSSLPFILSFRSENEFLCLRSVTVFLARRSSWCKMPREDDRSEDFITIVSEFLEECRFINDYYFDLLALSS